MDTKEAIQASMDLSLYVLNQYLSDLDDADLMVRPGPGCNHLAWQLGHLIASEVQLLESVAPGKAATLPEGFAEAHGKDQAGEDDPSKFRSKAEYLELFGTVRAATLAALKQLPDEVLDQDSPEWLREHFPKQGQLFVLIGTHPMMHAGQFAVVRRALGKPVLM
ncbi:MAG: DinB family protein [Planctomycetales bacterium]|nr:DinB family protein [Planctomycetales bacterium]